MHVCKFALADGDDTTCCVPDVVQGIQERRIIVAVSGGLHDHIPSYAKVGAQALEVELAGVCGVYFCPDANGNRCAGPNT